jgi:hypothetical protein
MKRFLFKAVCFATPMLLFLAYMEFRLGEVENNYNFKKANLENRLDSIEVLILGSSQAMYGINPEFFSIKAFNLSNASQSLFYDTRLALKYYEQMPSLMHVIITVSYFSFDYQVIDGPEEWRDFYYSHFWGIKYPEANRYDIRNYSRIALYRPDSSFSYLLQGFDVNLVRCSPNGDLEMDTTDNQLNISDSLGFERVRLHTTYRSEKHFKDNVSDLEFLVAQLRKKNIKPVIVTPPVFSTYYKFADTNKVKKNQDAISRICLKYNLEHYDYFKDSRFVLEDFFDNDHLNFVGAEKFSRILDEEIITMNSLSFK